MRAIPAETLDQMRDQQRLTTALSGEVTTLRHEQDDWQRQFSVLQERTAAMHADLLAACRPSGSAGVSSNSRCEFMRLRGGVWLGELGGK